MTTRYTSQEDKELNADLKKLQKRASKIILDDYYDHIFVSDISTSILQQITNAKSHYDISPYLWNTGMMDKTVAELEAKIKVARKEDRGCRK